MRNPASDVAELLNGKDAGGLTLTLATNLFKGFVRPWHAGILFRKSKVLGEALVAALSAPGLIAAANEPYTIDDDGDYTVPVHGEARGLDAALVEIRQDLIADDAGAEDWAHRLAAALLRLP